jgi:hypothetical protein
MGIDRKNASSALASAETCHCGMEFVLLGDGLAAPNPRPNPAPGVNRRPSGRKKVLAAPPLPTATSAGTAGRSGR